MSDVSATAAMSWSAQQVSAAPAAMQMPPPLQPPSMSDGAEHVTLLPRAASQAPSTPHLVGSQAHGQEQMSREVRALTSQAPSTPQLAGSQAHGQEPMSREVRALLKERATAEALLAAVCCNGIASKHALLSRCTFLESLHGKEAYVHKHSATLHVSCVRT
jgi:hypothetical protein